MGRSRLHRTAVGISAAAVVVVAAASFAWACTAAPGVVFRSGQGSASSSAGPAGSKVALEGRDWAEGPVEVRWNSSTGEELGRPTTANGSFSVTVTIPGTAKPGVYTLYFSQNGLVARASFEVTPAETTGGAGGPGGATGTGQNSAATSGAEGQQSGGGGRTATSTSGGSSAGLNGTPNQGGAQTFASGSDESGSEATPGPGSSAAPARTPTDVPAAASSGAAGPRSGRSAAVAPSGAAGATAPAEGLAAATAPADDKAAQAPTGRVVSGDLYSGFDTSEGASLLPDVADSARSSSGPLGQAALAVSVLGFSLVALFGGFAAAELRRRKVPARTS